MKFLINSKISIFSLKLLLKVIFYVMIVTRSLYSLKIESKIKNFNQIFFITGNVLNIFNGVRNTTEKAFMFYHPIHTDDYLWYLILCGKKTKPHPNTKFFHFFQWSEQQLQLNQI